MTEVSKELMIILPARVVLILKAPHSASGTQSFEATVYSTGPQGIIWRSQINHPNARSFSPWHEVERIDW
jgi:hypothetical protein